MKIKLITPLLFVAATLPAAADTIADWTFETTPPVNAAGANFGPYAADVGTGTLTAHHASATTPYSHQVGNGSGNSLSSSMWAINDYYQVQFSTLGFSSIQLSYDQISSGTGPGKFLLEYSTDGTTFVPVSGSDYTVTASSWSSGSHITTSTFTPDLSSITAIDNDSTVYLRFLDDSTTSANGGTVGTTGTDRMDNILITATSLTAAAPEQASTFALLTTSLVGLGFLARRKK